jgi:dipeptidyl aminopeptidase/acylaminoacyl peptidase
MEEAARVIAPYGSWKSPITAAMVAGGSVGLDQVCPDDGDVYWLEKRPAEGGRQVIVRLGGDGRVQDMTPTPFNARTRIHEYGGQCYTVAGGMLVFSNLADGRLYCQEGDDKPRAITPKGPFRYGDLSIAPDGSSVICVREECVEAAARPGCATRARTAVTTDRNGEPIDAIVSIELAGDSRHGDCFPGSLTQQRSVDQPARNDENPPLGAQEDGIPGVRVLVQGSDFYGAPRLSPDGRQMAWLVWNHPNMPWDGTELWLGEMSAEGGVVNRRLVAGGTVESIFQPEWSPGGTLYFVSDRSGWWNLYRLRRDDVEALHPMEAEFGLPGWVLGLRCYDVAGPGQIACAYCRRGAWGLALLDTELLAFEPVALPYTQISGVRGGNGAACFVAGSPLEAAAVVRLDLTTHTIEVLRRSGDTRPDPAFVSSPRTIEFLTEHGRTAHGFFYSPRNRDFARPPGEHPPLLVMCHGGPTDAVSPTLSLGAQFWTSRGFAVVQVNYGGSTGYGREYRERLNGQWGVVDVEDCTNAARYLAAQGLVDGKRMAIRGGSAGGFTALRALTTTNLFRAGAIHYGVSDLEMLAQDMPKFESRYHLRLVGPYPGGRALYRERSPVYSAECISAALILFHGLEDEVVLPSQAEGMVRAARAKGLPVAYLAFEGEGHGFRRAETIQRALEAELYFYSRVFGFALADPIDPVPIENL